MKRCCLFLALLFVFCLVGCSSNDIQIRERTLTVEAAVWSQNEFRIDGVAWSGKESEVLPTLYGCKNAKLNDPINTFFEQPDGTHGVATREIISFDGLDSCQFHLGYAFDPSSQKLLRGGYTLIQNEEQAKLNWSDYQSAMLFLLNKAYGLNVSGDIEKEELVQALMQADGSEKIMTRVDFIQNGIRFRVTGVWNIDPELPTTIQLMLDRID